MRRALLGLLLLGACAPAEAGDALGPGAVTVLLEIEHSKFVPDRVVVAAGSHVTFLIVNGDPIDHEFIIGTDDVHDRHANGTEAEHGTVPGEVTVRAGETAETTFHFSEAGELEFACHLPRHYEYGMRGVAVTSGRR